MLSVASYFVPVVPESADITDRRRAYLNWFVNTYPETEFRKDEQILYNFLKYVEIYEAPFSDKALEAFCAVELRTLVLKRKIRVQGAEGLNLEDIGQQMEAISVTQRSLYDMVEIMRSKPTDISEFIITVDIWMNKMLEDSLTQMYNEGMGIIESISNKRTGVRDATEYTYERVTAMQDLYSKEKLLELLDTGLDDEQFDFSFNTGIAPIDAVTGGLFTTELISIEAPPGIGKSKFVICQLMWRAAVLFKKSCLFFSLEQTKKEIDALVVARHYYYLYREIMDEANIRIKANYNQLPEETKQKILAARDDLYNNPDYGKLEVQCTSLRADTFLAKIRRLDKLKGPFDVVFIDYVGLIEKAEQKYGQRKDFETIGDCLTSFKAYLRASNKVGVAVNQLGAEGTERARKGLGGIESGAQGGMIVYRSTDKNIIISCTDEQKAQHKRVLELSKGRGVANLITTIVNTKLCMGAFFAESAEIRI